MPLAWVVSDKSLNLSFFTWQTTLDDNPWEYFSTPREKNGILTDAHNKNSILWRGKDLKVNEPCVFN